MALEIYEVTKKLPRIERGNLVNQMRRAATAIPLNIAEGSVRPSYKDYLYFLVTALGSGKELDVCLSLCRDLGYIQGEKYNELVKKLDRTNATMYIYMREIEKKKTHYSFFQPFVDNQQKSIKEH